MLDGKAIVVTGGGSGIGRTTALCFGRDAAKVTVADIDLAAAQDCVAAILAEGGEAQAVRCDVADEASVQAMVDAAVARYGKLDGAFNNAGVEMHGKQLSDLDAAEWARVRSIDLDGVFYCMKHEIAAMRETGGGAIVNTASVAAVTAQTNMADYCAAKAGVTGLTRAAAAEFPQTKVRANTVLPGVILTPMVKDRLLANPEMEAVFAPLVERHSVGRFGEPEDVAQAVRWLLSDMSAYINGVALPVDGGYTAR